MGEGMVLPSTEFGYPRDFPNSLVRGVLP